VTLPVSGTAWSVIRAEICLPSLQNQNTGI